MATHFARGMLNEGYLNSARLSTACHDEAQKLPQHQRTRFLSSRALLAELLFMLYSIDELPAIVKNPQGKPLFSDPGLPRFSIAYSGNIVGVALTQDGDCGLDMALLPSGHSLVPSTTQTSHVFSSNEMLWINNQNDPQEARTQLFTLRQSVLKLSGEALNDSPQRLQLLPGSGRLRTSGATKIEALCDAEDVLVWSIAATPAIEQLTVWEYGYRTGWRRLPDLQARTCELAGRLMRFTSLAAEKALILN